jgi:hypothetical protein
MGFGKFRPTRSVFYSLGPGLGKRRAMSFLRNDCRQFRGDFQRSAHEFARTAEFQLRWGAVDVDARVLECASPARSQFRLLTSNNPRTSQRKRHRLPISNAIEAASSSGSIAAATCPCEPGMQC